MPKGKALTQKEAWDKHRRELIRMIGAGLIERNNNIVIATIADTDGAILTTVDLIPMGTESIIDELECIAGTYKGPVIELGFTPEEIKKLEKGGDNSVK